MFRDTFIAVAGSLVLTGLASAQAGNVDIQPAMGDPVRGLTPSQLDRFQKGLVEFEHILAVLDRQIQPPGHRRHKGSRH